MTAISSEELKEIKFKGTQVAYAVVCLRKLWLFSRGITLEQTSDRVAFGKFLDETSFKDKEGYSDENVSIDFITIDDELVVHEIKLSDALEDAHKAQIKYYIYYLRHNGVAVSYGLLHYPKLRKIKKVELEREDEVMIENTLAKIEKTLELSKPPTTIKVPYCKKCAYYEFCYG